MLRRLLPLLLLAVLLPASAASASATQETGMADDATLFSDFGKASAAAQAWAAMGVDTARITARWDKVAPAGKKRPRGFDGSDPGSDGYQWQYLDQAVDLVVQNGMVPIMTVTGPGPIWSNTQPSKGSGRIRPSTKQFGDFASAVAKRYGDRVSRYILWNEPNLPEYLQPQFTCKGKRCTPTSPGLYRELYRSGAAALKAADPGAVVYAGALAPRGGSPTAPNAKVRPLAFIRSLACVTTSYKRDRSGACKSAKTIKADAFSYHPHAVLNSPTQKSRVKDDASIADLPRLERALDRATKAGVLKPVSGSRFQLELTEFGYQTNPPDKYSGVSTTKQADYVQQATYVAAKDPRVANLTQYEYIDEPIKANQAGTDPFSSWQSGLYFSSGRAKPLLAAFPNPFWVQRISKGRAIFWGQVRPGGQHTVTVQKLVDGAWVDQAGVSTSDDGMFQTTLSVTSQADYRYTYDAAPAADGTPVVGMSTRRNVQP